MRKLLILSALISILSACGGGRADKDISAYIEAWKTSDQSQTQVCRPFYTTDLEAKMEADTTEDHQQSYLDFLETLNGLRDYAKKNPSSRVEIRNTLYEVYGKTLYGSDKKDYLEAMRRSTTDATAIKALLQGAMTDKIDDREIFMKGIDYSYYYEQED